MVAINNKHSQLLPFVSLIVALLFFCPKTASADANPKLAESVNLAFKNGDDKTAYDILYRALLKSYSFETEGNVDDTLVRLAYSHLTNNVRSLSEKTILTNKTTLANLKFHDAVLKAAKQDHVKLLSSTTAGNVLVGGSTAVGGVIPLAAATAAVAHKQQKKHASRQKVIVPNIEVVSQTLNQYEAVKEFVEKWIALEALQAACLKNVPKHLKTKKHLERIKANVTNERTRFISYVAFSPVLAETSRRLELSKKSWGRHSKGKTRSAIDYLSANSRREWIRECNQEVRIQFLDLIKEIKKLVGDKEFRDLEARAAILKSDSDKSVGGKLWWP